MLTKIADFVKLSFGSIACILQLTLGVIGWGGISPRYDIRDPF